MPLLFYIRENYFTIYIFTLVWYFMHLFSIAQWSLIWFAVGHNIKITLIRVKFSWLSNSIKGFFLAVNTRLCITGYELVGSSVSTCRRNGLYNPRAPICQRKSLLFFMFEIELVINPELHKYNKKNKIRCKRSGWYFTLIEFIRFSCFFWSADI